jgi:hypothetical protein
MLEKVKAMLNNPSVLRFVNSVGGGSQDLVWPVSS